MKVCLVNAVRTESFILEMAECKRSDEVIRAVHLSLCIVVLTEVPDVCEPPSPWSAVGHQLSVQGTEDLVVAALTLKAVFTAMQPNVHGGTVEDTRHVTKDGVSQVEAFLAPRLHREVEYLAENSNNSFKERRRRHVLEEEAHVVHRQLLVGAVCMHHGQGCGKCPSFILDKAVVHTKLAQDVDSVARARLDGPLTASQDPLCHYIIFFFPSFSKKICLVLPRFVSFCLVLSHFATPKTVSPH